MLESPEAEARVPARHLVPPPGWCWCRLDQVKSYSLYGPRFSNDDYSLHGKPVVRTSDISESGKVSTESAPKPDLDAREFDKYRIAKDDILITRTGSLGTLAVFDDDVEAIPGAHPIQYRPAAPIETSWQVFHVLKSRTYQKLLIGRGAGVGRPNLNAPRVDRLTYRCHPWQSNASSLQRLNVGSRWLKNCTLPSTPTCATSSKSRSPKNSKRRPEGRRLISFYAWQMRLLSSSHTGGSCQSHQPGLLLSTGT